MRIMCRAVFHRPVLHCRGNFVGNGNIQLAALGNHLMKLFIGRGRQTLLHFRIGKNIRRKDLFKVCHNHYHSSRLRKPTFFGNFGWICQRKKCFTQSTLLIVHSICSIIPQSAPKVKAKRQKNRTRDAEKAKLLSDFLGAVILSRYRHRDQRHSSP